MNRSIIEILSGVATPTAEEAVRIYQGWPSSQGAEWRAARRLLDAAIELAAAQRQFDAAAAVTGICGPVRVEVGS